MKEYDRKRSYLLSAGLIDRKACYILNRQEFAKLIDHTNLKANAICEDIRTLCREAITHKFGCVVVNPWYVPLARQELRTSDVLVCSVIGFPLGASISRVKALEARTAVEDGASEIDMVLNIAALKSGLDKTVREDIRFVADQVNPKNITLKVIIEACYLTEEEKKQGCRLAVSAGADFVKSSTGFADGATTNDIRLMRATVGNRVGVKAAGGIRSYEDSMRMMRAGANRIGTSSSVKIMKELADSM